MKRDVNENDIILCTEIIKSFGLFVKSHNIVWSSLFVTVDDWSLSLSILNDINDDLRERTDFYCFGVSVDKNDNKLLTIALGMKS